MAVVPGTLPMSSPAAGHGLSTSVVNMALRAAGLVSRLALTIFIAKYLDLESLGVASFVFAGVAFAPALLTFGLHHQLNRNIISRPLEEAGWRLRDRMILHGLLIASLAVVTGALVLTGQLAGMRPGIAAWLAITVFLIVSMELVAVEIHLGLVSLKESTVANAFLFLRSASWAPLFIGAAFLFADLRSISAMLAFWMCGFAVAFGYLAQALRHWPWQAIIRRPADFPWLLRDLRRSLLIYGSDVSMMVAQYSDRVIIGALLGLREAGIYFFYWSLAAGVHQLIHSSVVQVALPKMMEVWRGQAAGEFVAAVWRDIRMVLVWSGLLGTASTAFVAVLVAYMDEADVAAFLHFLPILLLGTALRVAAEVLCQALYVMRRDHALTAVKYVWVVGTLVLTPPAIFALGINGAPLAMALSSALFLLSCGWVLRKEFRR
jgi:O-antigen/teichoic acid export membrane protein